MFENFICATMLIVNETLFIPHSKTMKRMNVGMKNNQPHAKTVKKVKRLLQVKHSEPDEVTLQIIGCAIFFAVQKINLEKIVL